MTKIVIDVIDGAIRGELEMIAVLAGVALLVLLALYLLLSGSRSKGRSVLLVGLCDSGKTMLYSRLVLKQPAKTHTSIATNSGLYKPEKCAALTMVDIPGHERLRLQMIEPVKKNTRALVFVVDSLTLQKEVKDVAEYLYTLLTDEVLSSTAPPLLIACNKHDLTMAKGAKVIQSQLEKEMNLLRTTRSSTLESTTQTGNNNTFLGCRGKDFSFSDIRPFKVEFKECSAKTGEIGSIVDFLDRIA